MSGNWPETILDAAQQLRARKLSPVELTRTCLERIEALNPTLNAFILVTAEQALDQARTVEQEIQRENWKSLLHGIPVSLKDLIDTASIPTTAASLLYRHRVPSQDALVAQKLKQAGAILLGKQNLHEFAYGGSSMISAFGEVRNPWNPAYIAGGSSGGSAAAVAAGLGYAAIGTDTAGSIREPAALCGVVGLKPTYGRVSARGVIPLSESLDHVGPLVQTVADAAIVLRSLAEENGMPPENFLDVWERASTHLRVGVPRAFFYEDLYPEVAQGVEASLRVIASLGAEIREVALTPDNDRTVQAAESYAFHAAHVAKTPELYQPETLRRIRSGENISQQDYQRKLVELKAQRENIRRVFDEVDMIATPTTPIPAPRIAELKQNPDLLRPRELVLLRNTRPFNVWGLPAISIPCGLTQAGLPIGLQLAAAPQREDLLLEFAYACERALRWRERIHAPTPNSLSS
ncbi:MAG TPA: amidase [Terriglobales bacterium]|nr:amidase [Terriglobales bacterium]